MRPAVKFPDDTLSLAELSAAALDGDVVALGEGYVATDAPETPWLRARSLAPVLAPNLAATHAVAAWIWGAQAQCPTVLTVQRATAHRVTVHPRARVVYRDGYVGEADIIWFGDVAVTTLERTVADLARVRDLATIALLAFNQPACIDQAIAWCQQHTRLPGVAHAIEVLRRLTVTPSVDPTTA